MTPTKSGNTESWTDALTICQNTGIGYSTNQIYRHDGNPQEDHEYEDFSCHYKFTDNCYWYAIYDGHEGKNTGSFCCQKMAAEILFPRSPLSQDATDEQIKEMLRQAFISVEKEYLETIGSLLAERTSLMEDIHGLSAYEAYQEYPHIVEKIKTINGELGSGAASAVALIFNNKLYVANVGNCRVLLCQTDPNSVMKVVQLSVDHDLQNEDELLRLSQIGINTKALKNSTHLGNQENTRCLGNYLVKGGYKEFDDLCSAIQEPVSAEPDIHGGIKLDESCKFLLLMSSGLYKSVAEASGTDQVNQFIAQCVVEQFREQTTLTGVAQAAVDKVVRLHHDWHMINSINGTKKREDMTLILRNFNFPLPNDLRSPIKTKSSSLPSTFDQSLADTLKNQENSLNNYISSSGSSEPHLPIEGKTPEPPIPAYVNFADFYTNLEIAKKKNIVPAWILEAENA